nr:heme ABC exporter ATP-binding protein CcmA [Rubellimicrobium aerolatum]
MRVEGLAVARGGVPVLTGLSFAVAPGEALILRGPNGAGKTTLLRVLAGLAPPFAGRVEAPPESVAFASHADGIKAALTVTENLRFWADLYGRGFDAAILDDFDLRSLRDRPAGTLSAGQSRRLGLARLGVIGRTILLLDEPTVSLDVASVARFADWLRDRHLAAGGIAVIATHVPLGLDSPVLDLGPFRADPRAAAHQGTDAAFL